ncbi:MAG: hypothetical protein FJ128_10655 [Deltaproteobacteria bacterium]|nr:hypothetical protein [Deltaproteobacteria bacterium]
MFYTTRQGRSYHLERDFSSAERHLLQKLFIWQEMAGSVEEFRRRTREALLRGWGDSGPIRPGRTLQEMLTDLEGRVAQRLGMGKPA